MLMDATRSMWTLIPESKSFMRNWMFIEMLPNAFHSANNTLLSQWSIGVTHVRTHGHEVLTDTHTKATELSPLLLCTAVNNVHKLSPSRRPKRPPTEHSQNNWSSWKGMKGKTCLRIKDPRKSWQARCNTGPQIRVLDQDDKKDIVATDDIWIWAVH